MGGNSMSIKNKLTLIFVVTGLSSTLFGPSDHGFCEANCRTETGDGNTKLITSGAPIKQW